MFLSRHRCLHLYCGLLIVTSMSQATQLLEELNKTTHPDMFWLSRIDNVLHIEDNMHRKIRFPSAYLQNMHHFLDNGGLHKIQLLEHAQAPQYLTQDAYTQTLTMRHQLDQTLNQLPPLEIESYTTLTICLLYTSPSPRDRQKSRMPSSA